MVSAVHHMFSFCFMTNKLPKTALRLLGYIRVIFYGLEMKYILSVFSFLNLITALWLQRRTSVLGQTLLYPTEGDISQTV